MCGCAGTTHCVGFRAGLVTQVCLIQGPLPGISPRHCLPRACLGAVQDLPGAEVLQRVIHAAVPALGRRRVLTDEPQRHPVEDYQSSIACPGQAQLAFSCISRASCRAITSTITALGHAHGHESPNLLLRSMRRLLLLWRRCLPRWLWHVDRCCISRASLAVRVEQQHLHHEEVHP